MVLGKLSGRGAGDNPDMHTSPTPPINAGVDPNELARHIAEMFGDHTMRSEVSAMKKTGTTTVRYEAHTTIDRPIGDVFARLADLDRYGKWMHRTGLFRRSGQTSDGPVGPGTAYLDATRMGTFRGQITSYQQPSRIGFRETLRWFGSDLMQARPEYFLETDRDRTIVHHVAEGDLFGLMRLMKPLAALLARSERTRTVKSLRRSLESG